MSLRRENLRFTSCWTFICENCLRLGSESLESVILAQKFCRRMLPPFLGSHTFIRAYNKLNRLPNHTAFCFKRRYISLRVRLDGPIFEFHKRQNICIFSKTSRPSTGPNQPLTNFMSWFFSGAKAARACSLFSVEVKNEWRFSSPALHAFILWIAKCYLLPYLRPLSSCRLRNRVHCWRGALHTLK